MLGELHGTVAGAGEPLVFLHGNGEDKSRFDAIAPAFTDRYQVICLDTRGHGETPRGAGPLNFARFVEDLRITLDDVGVEAAHLVGFSDGGNIALAFGVAYPERVLSLTAYGANLYPSGLRRRLQATLWVASFGLHIAAPFARRAIKAKREVIDLMITQPHIKPASLARITAPALIAAGDRDLIRERHTVMIARSLPNARCEIVPRATHFLPGDDPQRFIALVDHFLSTLG